MCYAAMYIYMAAVMRTSRIQIAKPDIVSEFSQHGPVFRPRELSAIFNARRDFWRLAKSMTLTAFTRFMLDKTDLRHVRYDFPNRPVSGFTWGDVPTLETVLELVDGSYLSHFTAMRIHGLTEQLPKTVYFSKERSTDYWYGRDDDEIFEQDAIDAAFRRPPRISHNAVTLPNGQGRLMMLEGAYQEGRGVISGAVNFGGDRPLNLRYTDLERTLIDIVVRPFYAGGVFEVAKAFENARGELSGNAMLAMLKGMNFGYPYHQAIGYYLDRSGYKPSVVNLYRRLPMERDFYLAHGMESTRYIPRWRLHVPEGFEL